MLLTCSLPDASVYPHLYKCQGTVSGHTGPVWTMVNSDNYLFSGSSDRTIKVNGVRDNAFVPCVKAELGVEYRIFPVCGNAGRSQRHRARARYLRKHGAKIPDKWFLGFHNSGTQAKSDSEVS